MSVKRTIARNAIWNWLGVIVGMITGFVVSPFLVRTLGDTGYGLWLVIASLTGYFGLLDLGMRSSVGRNIAFYRGKGDQANVNVMLSTALVILGIACVIALVGTFAVLPQFLRFFDVPSDQTNDARIALIYVGISFSLMLPFSVFDAVLWGFQRFDLLNGIDIIIAIIRTSSTFYLLSRGYGIVALAQVTLVTSQLGYLLKGIASFLVDPQLRMGLRFVSREGAKKLFGYGMWSFVISMANLLTSQLSLAIIGSRLGLGLVTPYGIANRLVRYGITLVSSGTSVLTPYSASLEGGSQEERQRQLFIHGGRLCLAFTLFFTYNFLFLGGALVRLWQGPGQASATALVHVLILGETLASSQFVSHAIILGMGRPKTLALIYIADAVCVVGSTLFLSHYGLFWICIGIATSATLIRGVVTLVCVAAAVNVPITTYLYKAVLPALAATLLPALVLAAAVAWHMPATWTELILYGGCFTIIYFGSCLLLVGADRLRSQLGFLGRGFCKSRNSD